MCRVVKDYDCSLSNARYTAVCFLFGWFVLCFVLAVCFYSYCYYFETGFSNDVVWGEMKLNGP